MKESKKEFKYALRACRRSQQKCKADAMAEALRNRSPKKFKQSIRKNKKSWLPSAVGRETTKMVKIKQSLSPFSITELIKKLWNWQFCAPKYNLTW